MSVRFCSAHATNFLTLGVIFGSGVSPGFTLGMYPYVSSKGANLDDPLMVEFNANSVIGSLSVQSD